jgi:hypothetical protein
MSKPNHKILGDKFGFVFELGVNIGILAGIRHLTNNKKIVSKIHSFYNDELKNIKSSDIVSRLRKIAITNEVVDPTLLKKTETFIEYLIFLGVHKGFDFIVEYCQVMQQQDKSFDIQLLYYQCDLQQLLKDDNVRYKGLIPKLETMFQQFDCKPPNFYKYTQTGQFFKADTIMLFLIRNKYRVVVIDVGLFSVPDITHVPDLRDVITIKQRLSSTYRYMREKTAFESINIDSDKVGIPFSDKFSKFFEAFSRDDKDTKKMIQAGSYAHSFVQCLKKLQPQRFNDDTLEVNVIGLTDRAYNAMFISKKEDMPILSTIYRKGKENSPDMPYSTKRVFFQDFVFEHISNEFKQTLRRNKDNTLENPTEKTDMFVEKLQILPPSDTDVHKIAYSETFKTPKDFSSTADNVPTNIMTEVGLADGTLTFRQAHTQLTRQALNGNELLLFLTGHPGIGKTTAIVDYILDKQVLSEGILFFYFSPRTQVNYDIIEKVSEIQNGKRIVKDDDLMCIYSNSTLISHYGGQPVIKYVCNTPLPQQLKMPSVIGSRISTLKLVADEEAGEVYYRSASGTQSCNDTQIDYSSNAIPGVLKTVCSAICTLRQAFNTTDNIPKNIIATATVQSLKKTDTSTTAEHLRKIFAEAAKNELKDFGDGTQLKQIAKTTKHIIFMVDEVIGDSGGAELLHELVKLSQNLKLYQHFQLKIIASDASIAGKDVIQQHLLKPEPSPAKILYRQISQSIDENAISIQTDKVKMGIYDIDATLINANTFPASEIVLNYKVSVEMASLDANRKKVDIGLAWLQEDIFKLLRNATDGQIIVYIQDIQKLHQLIKAISEKQTTLPNNSFEEFKDYLLIHSRISNEARQQIHQCKNTVKIIFMTSSASRGLTFARVRHILIEVPKFQIEYNLMEIIQTVYRGRGGETDEEKVLEKKTRWITFYLHDVIYYAEWEQRQERYQRGITALMNIILLVRAALKTRIAGYGDIGCQEHLRIIPVSGKHVDSVGHSLLIATGRLLEEIRKEIRRSLNSHKVSYDKSLAKLRKDIQAIFVRTQTQVANETLKKVNTYYEGFAQCATKRLYDVLTYNFESEYYMDGDIITVPISKSKERINMTRDMLKAAQQERLVARMYGYANNSKYADSLKIALKNMAKEIEALQNAVEQTSKSQDIYSKNTSGGQYLSIPLPVFFKPEIFQKYFQSGSETATREEAESTQQEETFRFLLGGYLKLLYPINDKLPLDGGYEKFPFLLFRCDNFTALRQQRFDRRYLFSSTAFNLINLILSQDSNSCD